MRTRIAGEIRLARTTREREAALALRRRVFCEEQGVPPELEVDGRDGEALHVVAVCDGEVVEQARGAGGRRVALHAQADAVGLYERAGFRTRGESFQDAGIDHVRMERGLATRA